MNNDRVDQVERIWESREDIPLTIQLILQLAETGTTYRYHKENHGDPSERFFSGLFDYWWEEDLEEAHFEQIFRKDLVTGELKGFPSHERFCYQQGAVVGQALREEFKEEDMY